MKSVIFGMVALGTTGAVVIGAKASGPNDYVGTVARPPSALYAAFSALGREGAEAMPLPGSTFQITQRITKVLDEELRLDMLADGRELLSIELEFAPVDGGTATEVSAEIDVDEAAVSRMIETMGQPLPPGVMQEHLIDTAFAQALHEMIERVDAGETLPPLGLSQARWGMPAMGSAGARMRQRQAAAPGREATRRTVDPRPMISPNDVARNQMESAAPRPGTAPRQGGGW